jgi:MFS family permease
MSALTDTPDATAYARRRNYTLFLLTALSAVSFMDRQILAVMIEPVKAEFALTDLQVGIVSSLGFAFGFGLLGLPLARLADRGHRRNLVVVSRGLGGLITALGGASAGFWHLLILRSGTALSEAGGSGSAISMISDLFPPWRRSRAMSVLASGASIGAMMAFVAGASLAARFGWRITLVIVGLASLLLAALVRLTVREPQREAVRGPARALDRGDLREILGARVPRWLIVAAASNMFVLYSFGTWNFAYMVRTHGFSLQQAGWIAGGSGAASVLGGLFSGALADRLVRRGDSRWQLGVPVLGLAIAIPVAYAYLLLPAGRLVEVWALMLAYAFFVTWWSAPTYAALSLVVAPERRATANSMLLISGYVLGLGAGPIVTGLVSSLLAARYPHDALRYSLMAVTALLLPGWYALFRAMQAYPEASRITMQETAHAQ